MRGPDVLAALARDRPRFHASGDTNWFASSQTLRALHDLAGPGAHTLETGCGASTVVFAASGAAHTVVSPVAQEHDLVREYCRRIGVECGNVEFVVASSDDVLPGLSAGRDLDLVFIDGAHSFPHPVIDWHYATRRLKAGGRLVLDDIPIPSIAWLFAFMRREPNWRLDGVLDDRAALFTMLAQQQPEGGAIQLTNRRHDYSFAPLPARIRLSAADRAGQIRYAASQRFPRARRAWRGLRGPRG